MMFAILLAFLFVKLSMEFPSVILKAIKTWQFSPPFYFNSNSNPISLNFWQAPSKTWPPNPSVPMQVQFHSSIYSQASLHQVRKPNHFYCNIHLCLKLIYWYLFVEFVVCMYI
jgi:hypothetical protein